MKVIKIYIPKNIINATLICIDTAFNLTKLTIYFVKNNKIHNSKFPAEYIIYNIDSYKYYLLYDLQYYANSNKHWKKRIKQIKQENKLKIFK